MSGVEGVILAAGRGLRMGPLGEGYPKAVLPVGNRPIIEHHLEFLRTLGCDRVHVVIGHRAADVVHCIESARVPDLDVRFVQQDVALGSAHALGLLRTVICRPFLLLLGDYFLWTSAPRRMVARLAGGSEETAIAAKRELDRAAIAEGCLLDVDGTGRVLGIVEKPILPVGNLKGCGFYALQPKVFDAVSRTPRTALRDEYELSVALELHVQSGRPLFAEEIVTWDANLTRPEDLLRCNLAWLDQVGSEAIVADDANVAPGAELHRSVVGPGAHVGPSARLSEVVVFPGGRVEAGQILSRAIVTPTARLSCDRLPFPDTRSHP